MEVISWSTTRGWLDRPAGPLFKEDHHSATPGVLPPPPCDVLQVCQPRPSTSSTFRNSLRPCHCVAAAMPQNLSPSDTQVAQKSNWTSIRPRHTSWLAERRLMVTATSSPSTCCVSVYHLPRAGFHGALTWRAFHMHHKVVVCRSRLPPAGLQGFWAVVSSTPLLAGQCGLTVWVVFIQTLSCGRAALQLGAARLSCKTNLHVLQFGQTPVLQLGHQRLLLEEHKTQLQLLEPSAVG